jgi:hypothetical protein
MPQTLTQQIHDVTIVERIEHHPPVAARPHQPQTAQQAKLVRDGRLR